MIGADHAHLEEQSNISEESRCGYLLSVNTAKLSEVLLLLWILAYFVSRFPGQRYHHEGIPKVNSQKGLYVCSTALYSHAFFTRESWYSE